MITRKHLGSLVIVSVIIFAHLGTKVVAQSTDLPTLVAQLQKTPTDNVLREKIIKFAASMKSAPVVPDEAIRFEGRAQYAFKSAKSAADYLVAAQEYEKAVVAAPWIPGYYSDLCTIYDKAGKPEDAKRNCQFYLIGLTDPDQITDAKRRIAGLEFAIEKANSPEAKVDKVKQEFVDVQTRIDGAVMVSPWEQIEISHPNPSEADKRDGRQSFGGKRLRSA